MDQQTVLTTALAEAERSERHLFAQYAVTRALAEFTTLEDAGQMILRAIGKSMDWDLGIFWKVNDEATALQFVNLWHTGRMTTFEFVEDSRKRTFKRGEGLIGRVWATGKPIWIADVAIDPVFRPGQMAARVGLHGGCAFPVRKGDRIYGVIELFSQEIRATDEDMLDMVADIGIKVGQFIDRKQTEEELHRAEIKLFEEARLAEVARVLGDIAHDINNMLMPVVNGASLLAEELNECYERLPQPVAAAAQRSHALTKELIDMILHGSGRVQDRVREFADSVKGLSRSPQFGPCRITDVVSSVYAILRIPAGESGVTLCARDLESLPLIRADENRLFNALYNLVNNAIPEVPSGGSITVQGRVEETGPSIVISVIDTGKGMSLEVRESLFTYQAISRKVGGTGLGTKIVKDVVEAHGGKITVESEQGIGSSFHITLPVEGPPVLPRNSVASLS
ncbi:MAG: ATP-binding protein [Nitrospiraceae bacterium]